MRAFRTWWNESFFYANRETGEVKFNPMGFLMFLIACAAAGSLAGLLAGAAVRVWGWAL